MKVDWIAGSGSTGLRPHKMGSSNMAGGGQSMRQKKNKNSLKWSGATRKRETETGDGYHCGSHHLVQ